jgi:hypothetical protein
MKNLLLVLLFTLLTQFSFAQTQLGADIDGENKDNYCGTSVSMSADGKTVAIGAPGNDGKGEDAGHVRIYRYSAGVWTQLGSDIQGEAELDGSGFRVSLSADGNTVAIGAPNNDYDAGHVRIYKYASGVWAQLGGDIDGEESIDESGASVSLSADGTIVAIGAPFNNGNDWLNGQVRVYKYAAGAWTQLGNNINGKNEDDEFGTSVSMSADGSIVAIGAPGNNGNGIDAGHVRIFNYISGSWTQLGSDINGEASEDESGTSVSISADGSIVAIGAPVNSDNGLYSGHVRIFKYTSGNWKQLGADLNGEAVDDESGTSVSISADGTMVAIGAPFNSEKGTLFGHVRIFKYNGGAWTKWGYDINGEAEDNVSGYSVSMSADGKTVAIGAPGNDEKGLDAGHVRVYSIENSTSINRVTEIKTIGIYPNPASKEIKITADVSLLGNTYKILNSMGQVVLNGTLIEQSTRIDLGSLSAGYYLLSVGVNNIQTHKLVIE